MSWLGQARLQPSDQQPGEHKANQVAQRQKPDHLAALVVWGPLDQIGHRTDEFATGRQALKYPRDDSKIGAQIPMML